MPHPLIEQLGLIPHPEGGHFRELYRSDQQVTSPVKGEQRVALTHIYFLLCEGEVSRFHQVCHDEIWNHYAGAPIKLLDFDGEELSEDVIGPGQADFTHVIRGGNYQAAESTGEYSLVGCTVAPGFDFADFRFIDDPAITEKLISIAPELQRFI